MLLMKDRSFLYELRAYLIYVKVGESSVPLDYCLVSLGKPAMLNSGLRNNVFS